jgi:DNA polymerase elongation subunit (family B)
MGVLTSLVTSWKAGRLSVKQEAINLAQIAAVETDPIIKTKLDNDVKALKLQDSLFKVYLNTLYGLLGAKSFCLYHRPLAQSVTAYAR